ncbi:AAEL007935-PC, partial [Aedes aegypti]
MTDHSAESKSEIFKSYHRITTALKCCGLYPLITDPGKRTHLRYKLLNVLVILVAVTFYGYVLVCHSLESEIIRVNTGSVIIQRMLDIFHITQYIMAVAVPMFAFLIMDKTQRMLRGLEETNQLIVSSGGRSNAFSFVGTGRIGRFLQLAALVVPAVSMAAFIVVWKIRRLNFAVGFAIRFTKFICFCSYAQLWTQPTLLMLLIRDRFTALNRMMGMYFPTTPSCGGFLSSTSHTETVICNEKEQLAVLKQIKILHDKLNDVVELVNYCFSVQITFCVGLCFVIGVVCSFGLFRAFIYRNELFYMGVLNFVWYMYYLFFVLFFIAVGSKITREGKRIGVLVHKAINCASSSAVINELNIFSQQLLHRSPVITCGLFVYDWTLLYTMIGATATYLIILIQFDVSFPNLVNVNGTQTAASGV